MARYYSARLGTIYFTSDGTSGGIPCKLTIEGWHNAINPVAGVVRRANSGRPIVQAITRPVGDEIRILIDTSLSKTVWDSLKTAINNALTSNTTLAFVAVGDTGNITKTVRPFPNEPYAAESFRNGRIIRPVFRVYTV